MPVSYRYHAYSPQRTVPERKLKARAKGQFREAELSAHHTTEEDRLHYGHRFAETEERAHQKLEHPREPPKMSRPQQGGAGMRAEAGAGRGVPIGALPQTEEPMAEPEALLAGGRAPPMGELVADAMRNVQRVTGAIRDLGEASFRLARLPWDAARALRNRRNR